MEFLSRWVSKLPVWWDMYPFCWRVPSKRIHHESTPSPPPKLLRASHMASEMPAKSGICSMRSEVNKCTWGGCDKYLGLGPREGRWHGVQVLMGERWFGGGFFDGFCGFFERWNIRDWFLGEMAEKMSLSLSLSLHPAPSRQDVENATMKSFLAWREAGYLDGKWWYADDAVHFLSV